MSARKLRDQLNAIPQHVAAYAALLEQEERPVVDKIVADYLATHPSLVDLSAPTTAPELAAAIRLQVEHGQTEIVENDGDPDGAAFAIIPPDVFASRLLAAWRNLRSGSSPSTDAHPEASCQRCGRPNPVWFTPNEIWNAVMRGPNGREGEGHEARWVVVCPSCFAELAEAAGVGTKSAWQFAPERSPSTDAVAE